MLLGSDRDTADAADTSDCNLALVVTAAAVAPAVCASSPQLDCSIARLCCHGANLAHCDGCVVASTFVQLVYCERDYLQA